MKSVQTDKSALRFCRFHRPSITFTFLKFQFRRFIHKQPRTEQTDLFHLLFLYKMLQILKSWDFFFIYLMHDALKRGHIVLPWLLFQLYPHWFLDFSRPQGSNLNSWSPRGEKQKHTEGKKRSAFRCFEVQRRTAAVKLQT